MFCNIVGTISFWIFLGTIMFGSYLLEKQQQLRPLPQKQVTLNWCLDHCLGEKQGHAEARWILEAQRHSIKHFFSPKVRKMAKTTCRTGNRARKSTVFLNELGTVATSEFLLWKTFRERIPKLVVHAENGLFFPQKMRFKASMVFCCKLALRSMCLHCQDLA